MKIAIYGLGYVGFTAACCLASQGHEIIGIDVSADKVRDISDGKTPITEPQLDVLFAEARGQGLISASQTLDDLSDVDLAIVCVGTPSATDGSHNMSYIAEVARQIAANLTGDRAKPLTVAFRSTFRPGTMDSLIEPIFRSYLGADLSGKVELVYNPEFLRESSAVADFFNPPKIVIGTKEGQPSAAMDEMNADLEAPVFYTAYREAEITKFVDNTWHAVKVAYANEIGRVCHRMGISAKKVHEIFVSDTKLNISAYYTRPGGAFGGSCLPKDVRALQYVAQDVGAGTYLINALLSSNESHKSYQAEDIMRSAPAGGKILMVGLAFKADTDDLRESPNVDIARKLLENGYQLSVYDPSLKPENLRGQNLGYAYTHLPTMHDLLVDKATAESGHWDLIVASNRTVEELELPDVPVIATYQYD